MMTTHERRQLQDERNRLRRMNQVALERGIEANNRAAEFLEAWEPPEIEKAREEQRRADRYFALSDRTHHQLCEIIERLGMRW